jgi:hypothetical protein
MNYNEQGTEYYATAQLMTKVIGGIYIDFFPWLTCFQSICFLNGWVYLIIYLVLC